MSRLRKCAQSKPHLSPFILQPAVVLENLFCIADQTGNGTYYYNGDKVTAKSQGYNKQASTKERKTDFKYSKRKEKGKKVQEKKEREQKTNITSSGQRLKSKTRNTKTESRSRPVHLCAASSAFVPILSHVATPAQGLKTLLDLYCHENALDLVIPLFRF